MSKTYSTEGIVLKRRNYGEADRLVTIYTKHFGKVTCLAKGVRKMQSRKRGSLEPGTEAVFFFAKTKSIDILTQAKLINSQPQMSASLRTITQAQQILEIIDALTAEEQDNLVVYDLLCGMLQSIGQEEQTKMTRLEQFRLLLQELGFTYDKQFSEFGLKAYIEELANRRLRAKAYLTVSTTSLQ